MGCRPAWIIHEQRGRVAVCCCRAKRRIGGLGVYDEGGWRWLQVEPVQRGMALNNLPLGMCQVTEQSRGGWILDGTSVFIPYYLFIYAYWL